MVKLNFNSQVCGLTQDAYIKGVFIEPFAEKAISFSAQRAGELGGPVTSQCELAIKTHAYIMEVLNNSSFQSAPAQFMQDWKQKRGSTEELRGVEDSAMIFFQTIVLPKLTEFAQDKSAWVGFSLSHSTPPPQAKNQSWGFQSMIKKWWKN